LTNDISLFPWIPIEIEVVTSFLIVLKKSNDQEIDDEVELSANFHNHKLIQYFNEDIGPQFPDGFDTIIASAKDYFDLMFDANIMVYI
jgi:hypothetical protein